MKYLKTMILKQAFVYCWLDNGDLDEILDKHKENFEAHHGIDYDDYNT